MPRVYAFVAVLAAAGLAVPALASVNYNSSKSNTGNITFEKNCKDQHGTVVATTGGSSCKLAGMNEPHWTPPAALMGACTKDGGKATVKNGAIECNHGIATGRRQH
jgi:hypothetical protein